MYKLELARADAAHDAVRLGAEIHDIWQWPKWELPTQRLSWYPADGSRQIAISAFRRRLVHVEPKCPGRRW